MQMMFELLTNTPHYIVSVKSQAVFTAYVLLEMQDSVPVKLAHFLLLLSHNNDMMLCIKNNNL